jgi:hypothetical protein
MKRGSDGLRGMAESGVGTPWRRAENIRYDDNIRREYKVLHRRLSQASRQSESGVKAPEGSGPGLQGWGGRSSGRVQCPISSAMAIKRGQKP